MMSKRREKEKARALNTMVEIFNQSDTGIHIQKRLDPILPYTKLYIIYKNECKWIIDLNIKSKATIRRKQKCNFMTSDWAHILRYNSKSTNNIRN